MSETRQCPLCHDWKAVEQGRGWQHSLVGLICWDCFRGIRFGKPEKPLDTLEKPFDPDPYYPARKAGRTLPPHAQERA